MPQLTIDGPPQPKCHYLLDGLPGYMEGDDGYRTPIGDYRGNKFDKKYHDT